MLPHSIGRRPLGWKTVGVNLAVAFAYYGLADLSRAIASTPNSVTPVWPPDGLAVGAALLYGKWVLPGVCLGSFLANIQAFLRVGSWGAMLTSVLCVLGIAAGTTLGTWLGTSLLRRMTRDRYPFEQVADSTKFLVCAGLLGPTVNATVGVAMLVLEQKVPLSAYISVWLTWWISNVGGIFILTPVILSWSHWLKTQHKLPQFGKLSEKGIEAVVLSGFIFLVGHASFWSNYPLAYMLIPLLVWAAFRFEQPGTTLGMFLISTIAILGTVRGKGTFAGQDLNQSLMALQSFIAVVVFTSLVLSAILAERAQAQARLRTAFAELQQSNAILEQHSEELEANNQRLEQALQELARTQTQMIQSEKMSALGNLVAGVAHEINNPIGFLKGNIQPALLYIKDLLELVDRYQEQYPQENEAIDEAIEDIQLEFLREDLPKLIRSMEDGVERIEAISTSLRTFSRADRDRPVPFNLHEGIESTLLILKHRLKANQYRPAIAVVTNYGEIPLVECYAGQLNQVFMNILANAIDALDESCLKLRDEDIWQKLLQITITTELSVAQEEVIIRLKDNGEGMPEEVKARIFDHLFTTKAVGKGTGLGLAIAYQIITEKHHGTLEVESTPGKGAEFIITLPVNASDLHLQSLEAQSL